MVVNTKNEKNGKNVKNGKMVMLYKRWVWKIFLKNMYFILFFFYYIIIYKINIIYITYIKKMGKWENNQQ